MMYGTQKPKHKIMGVTFLPVGNPFTNAHLMAGTLQTFPNPYKRNSLPLMLFEVFSNPGTSHESVAQ